MLRDVRDVGWFYASMDPRAVDVHRGPAPRHAQPDRVLARIEGQGVSIDTPPEGPDGHWALPELSAEVASRDATLHIGPQFIVLETAATDAAAAVRVLLHDEGNGDRPITGASSVFASVR